MRIIGPGELVRPQYTEPHDEPTVLCMELLNLPDVLARLHHIVVTLVPRGQGRECRTWNAGKWAQEQPG